MVLLTGATMEKQYGMDLDHFECDFLDGGQNNLENRVIPAWLKAFHNLFSVDTH